MDVSKEEIDNFSLKLNHNLVKTDQTIRAYLGPHRPGFHHVILWDTGFV